MCVCALARLVARASVSAAVLLLFLMSSVSCVSLLMTKCNAICVRTPALSKKCVCVCALALCFFAMLFRVCGGDCHPLLSLVYYLDIVTRFATQTPETSKSVLALACNLLEVLG